VSAGEGLDFKAPVFELSHHLLHRTHLVDNVQVILFVHCLIKRTRKLLSRVDQHFETLSIQLVSFRQRLSLALDEVFSDDDHVVLYFPLVNFYFTACLVVLLQETLCGTFLLTLLRLVDGCCNLLYRVTD